MTTPKTTLCVILHYGDPSYTWACVRSILPFQELDIVIVDNDPEQHLNIPDDVAASVRFVGSGGALGFSAANNLGVNEFINPRHRFIFILNNDTFVSDDSFRRLYEVLRDKSVGAVAPCMYYADKKDSIWACGGYIDKSRLRIAGIRKAKDRYPFQVDYLPGAAILCRRELWERVGGLPVNYFLAYEEAEFAMRLSRLGFKLMADPRAVIYHHVGMSSDVQPMYVYNAVRNRIRFGKFVHGKFLGAFSGLLNTTDIFAGKGQTPKERYHHLKLWSHAVFDEFSGKNLDREALQGVRRFYQDKGES